jgi:hypothetical protein
MPPSWTDQARGLRPVFEVPVALVVEQAERLAHVDAREEHVHAAVPVEVLGDASAGDAPPVAEARLEGDVHEARHGRFGAEELRVEDMRTGHRVGMPALEHGGQIHEPSQVEVLRGRRQEAAEAVHGVARAGPHLVHGARAERKEAPVGVGFIRQFWSSPSRILRNAHGLLEVA